MSYNVNGKDMLTWFYPITSPSNSPNTALTTNFRINNRDISNNYVGIKTNSNIPVSQIYTIPYNSGGQSIGNLFELNLPVFSGTINTTYKIWPPANNAGLLIQFLTTGTTTLKFNYNVDCSFVMVGGGGGGGNNSDSNAGGGGGAGQLITGSIISYAAGNTLTITIGNGGLAGVTGANTTLVYTTTTTTTTITANGGGYGGKGRGSSISVTGSSSGGTGSYIGGEGLVAGKATDVSLVDTSIFKSMISYNNAGSIGDYQNNDSGGGGGGGGAGAAAIFKTNEEPVAGGNGITITFGKQEISLGGGGGGGSRETGFGVGNLGGAGGLGGGGAGGGKTASGQTTGFAGTPNTGGGGGGGSNDAGAPGGSGGSGTIFFYILPSGVKL